MNLPHHFQNKSRQNGYSFFELILVLAMIGIVGSLALAVTASAYERTSNQKLRSDVITLNQAVKVYQANGGDLSTAMDSQDVLNRLKSHLSEHDAARFVGLTSSMIDVRIEAQYQTSAEAITDQLRAEWDPVKGRFVLGDAGGIGIKRFYFNDDLSDTEFESETRSHSGFMYAIEDEWIWDYEERPKLAPTQVTTVDIYFRDQNSQEIPPSTSPYDLPEEEPEGEPDPLPDPNSAIPLNPPLFTPEGGQLEYDVFPLEVALEDINEPGTSVIRYAINEGSFQNYAGPFTVYGDDIVRAYAATTDPEAYLNSAIATETYEQLPEIFDGDNKGKFKNGGNNGHGNNIDGVDVSNPGKAPFDDASGEFDDEKSTAVVSYAEENEVGIFTMGDPYQDSSPNILKYKGTQFIQVEPEMMFKVGTIDYFNGTISSGTGAEVVTMDVDVSLTTPDKAETISVFLGFENTVNNGTEWQNADSVVIRYRSIPLTQTLHGKNYYLVVELGQSTVNGHSEKGKLKVLENKEASVPVYGYFTTSPPVGD